MKKYWKSRRTCISVANGICMIIKALLTERFDEHLVFDLFSLNFSFPEDSCNCLLQDILLNSRDFYLVKFRKFIWYCMENLSAFWLLVISLLFKLCASFLYIFLLHRYPHKILFYSVNIEFLYYLDYFMLFRLLVFYVIIIDG